MKYGSRRRVQPKIRPLAPLDGCACAFEEWVYGGRKKCHNLMSWPKSVLPWFVPVYAGEYYSFSFLQTAISVCMVSFKHNMKWKRWKNFVFLQVCACNQARCCGEWKIRTDKPFQTEFLDSWLWYVIKSISIYITNLTTIKFSSRKKLLEGSNDVFHELSKIFILNEQQWKNEARFSYWKWFLHLLKTKWQTNKRLHFKWINSFHDNKVGKRW